MRCTDNINNKISLHIKNTIRTNLNEIPRAKITKNLNNSSRSFLKLRANSIFILETILLVGWSVCPVCVPLSVLLGEQQ